MPDLFSKALAAVGRTDLAKLASDNYSFSGREATILSYIGAHLKRAGAPAIEDAEKMTTFWGVRKEAHELATRVEAYLTPKKLAAEDFALVVDLDGMPIHKYAAYDKDSVIRAAEAFHENKAAYPYAWRKEAAARLIERAERYEAILPDYVNTSLHKSAGLGYPTAERIEDAIVTREQVAGPEHAEAIAKLAELAGQFSESPELRYDDTMVSEFIDTLDAFDTSLGQHKMAQVGLAEDIIDDGAITPELMKMAGASSTFVMLKNGFEVDAATIPPEALEAVDPELAKMASSELVDVLPTLDYEAASLLTRLL